MSLPVSVRDRIYFLVKDPHWTFLWWQLNPETVRRKVAQNEAEPGQLVLRIYDVTHILFDGENAHSWFDVEVFPGTDHWYLFIPTSNRNYLAEIGYRYPAGNFVPLARSHSIYLPRDQASDSGEEIWSTLSL